MLGTAYGEGRLTRDEYDARLEEAFQARTYGELDRLVSDLPVMQAPAPSPPAGVQGSVAGVNRLATASIICALAQFLITPLAIPAIVLGHMARHQIRQTGEQGAGLALTGLVLGWLVVVLLVLSIAVGLTASGGAHGSVPSH
jgi:hypothetical protein